MSDRFGHLLLDKTLFTGRQPLPCLSGFRTWMVGQRAWSRGCLCRRALSAWFPAPPGPPSVAVPWSGAKRPANGPDGGRTGELTGNWPRHVADGGSAVSDGTRSHPYPKAELAKSHASVGGVTPIDNEIGTAGLPCSAPPSSTLLEHDGRSRAPEAGLMLLLPVDLPLPGFHVAATTCAAMGWTPGMVAKLSLPEGNLSVVHSAATPPLGAVLWSGSQRCYERPERR